MAENKHTAGPWFCEYGTDGYYGLYHSGDLPLDDNIAENERLIAAAPDMLEALQAFVKGCDHLSTPELRLARAAILRATQPGEV